MKKLFLLSTLLLVALIASAQIKVAPKMQKGMKNTYISEVVTTIANQKPITLTSETLYEVTDETADGYVLDIVVNDLKTDADPNEVMGRAFGLSSEVMRGVHIIYAIDKDGNVTKILNYEEMKAKTEKGIDNLLDGLTLPENVISKKALKEQIMDTMTEESILQNLQGNTSPLALMGKTITTGMQNEFVNSQGMKMKRTYTVNADGTIQTASTMNLSKEEMKNMIIAQVEKLMPSQAEMIRQNIDTVINSGMVKMEVNENATYTLTADNWVDTIKSQVVSESMGVKTTAQTTVRLKK